MDKCRALLVGRHPDSQAQPTLLRYLLSFSRICATFSFHADPPGCPYGFDKKRFSRGAGGFVLNEKVGQIHALINSRFHKDR
jgi:hypothetical protein